MKLKVIKSPDRKFTPYIKDAANFYAHYLIPSKKLRDNLEIIIKFNDKMKYFGLANIEDYNNSGKPRSFLLEIHPWIGAKEILRTLAHEMVHVKQFVRGETNENLSKWMGVPIDSDTIDYYHQPWEMEAYSIEIGMFTKYVVKKQLWKVFKDIKNPDSDINKTKIKWK
jgi:hypothetical protein